MYILCPIYLQDEAAPDQQNPLVPQGNFFKETSLALKYLN